MPTNLSTRIRAIQKKMALPESGVLDIATCRNLIDRAGQSSSSTNLTTLVKMVQRIVNADADGIVGPQTLTRIEGFIDTTLPKISTGASLVVSTRSVDMIVFFEV